MKSRSIFFSRRQIKLLIALLYPYIPQLTQNYRNTLREIIKKLASGLKTSERGIMITRLSQRINARGKVVYKKVKK